MSLHTKMAATMAAIDRVPKNGYNDFHKFKYVTEADMAEAVRKHLADNGVAVYVSSRLVETREWRTPPTQKNPDGKPTLITHIQVDITFADGESGETMTITSAGTGDDASDKGTYKAITGAVKYALMKTFLVPTGDDPEQDEPARSRSRRGSGVERVESGPELPPDPLMTDETGKRIIALGKQLREAVGNEAAEAAYLEERRAVGEHASLTEAMAKRIITGLELRLSLAQKDSAGASDAADSAAEASPAAAESATRGAGSGGTRVPTPPPAAPPKTLLKTLAKLREELVGLVGGPRADEVWFELLEVHGADRGNPESLSKGAAEGLEKSLRLEVQAAIEGREFTPPPSVQERLTEKAS